MPASRPPFSNGSVSLGLSLVGDTARDMMDRLVDDARRAVAHGLDGVTLSEHHAGMPGYLPSPLSTSAALLALLESGWACAGPAILPLRNPVLVAEELAWCEALHPGRVGAAFVPGYHELDFVVAGADFADRQQAHWRCLDVLTATLAGDWRPRDLQHDHALAGLSSDGVPVLTGAAGPVAVRRAADLGIGILIPSLRSAGEVRELTDRYVDRGGSGPVVMIRRVHVGSSSQGTTRQLEQWRSRAGSAPWLDLSHDAAVTGEPSVVVDRLLEEIEKSRCTALNLRLECYAVAPEQVDEQISLLGEVLPRVRAELGW